MSTSLSWVIVLTFVYTSAGFTVGSRRPENDTAPANRHGGGWDGYCVGVSIGYVRRGCAGSSSPSRQLTYDDGLPPIDRPAALHGLVPSPLVYTSWLKTLSKSLFIRTEFIRARCPCPAPTTTYYYTSRTRCRYTYIYIMYNIHPYICIYPRYLRFRLPLFF